MSLSIIISLVSHTSNGSVVNFNSRVNNLTDFIAKFLGRFDLDNLLNLASAFFNDFAHGLISLVHPFNHHFVLLFALNHFREEPHLDFLLKIVLISF